VARQFKPLLVNTVVGFIGPNTCTTASRSFAPVWNIISAASCRACPWSAARAGVRGLAGEDGVMQGGQRLRQIDDRHALVTAYLPAG
jgi:hypothetical protein